MSKPDEPEKKCEWITDSKTGDLVMECFDGYEGARVPKQAFESNSGQPSSKQAFVVDTMKKNIERSLQCKLGDDCCSSGELSETREVDASSLLCYCFGITWQDYFDDPAVKQYVIEQTKNGNCECASQNPSGQCCLKDFPKNWPR